MIFVLKTILFLFSFIVFAAYMSLFERKLIGRIQMRLGPTECGVCGILQPIADAVKLFFKRGALKNHSKQAVFGVFLLFFASLCQLSIIPLSENLFLLNPKNGLLYVIFFHAILVFSEILIGTTSSSRYGVIGGIRSYLQIVGSHLPFVLLIICILSLTKTLNLIEIVNLQSVHAYVFAIFPLFVVFFITSLMLMNRTPFDFPEAESELVAGAYVEYGGILFAMIYLSDYLNIIFMSSIISIIFMGGYNPIVNISFIHPIFWLALKIITISGVIILIRAILPRYRQDQMIKTSLIILCPIIYVYIIFLI